MTLNVKPRLTDIATVPIQLPRNNGHNLAARALVCSQLLAADVNYGFGPVGPDAQFPIWEDAFSIGVRFSDETSNIFIDGKSHATPRRKGEIHILYLSGVEQIDFLTPRHTIEILLRRSFIHEIADDLEAPRITHMGRTLFHVVDDPLLRSLALRIHPFFDAPESLDPLFADHLMWGLGIYVCASYGDLTTRRAVAGGLSNWQERLAKDVIETRLVGGIGLSELAMLCGLRTSQFAHAFKRSTGVAPYQWLLQRRIARARDMLADGRTALADIALICGFSDQAHFTRSFARQVGATPNAWRSSLH